MSFFFSTLVLQKCQEIPSNADFMTIELADIVLNSRQVIIEWREAMQDARRSEVRMIL